MNIVFQGQCWSGGKEEEEVSRFYSFYSFNHLSLCSFITLNQPQEDSKHSSDNLDLNIFYSKETDWAIDNFFFALPLTNLAYNNHNN